MVDKWELKFHFIMGLMLPGIVCENCTSRAWHDTLVMFFLVAITLNWKRKDRPQP